MVMATSPFFVVLTILAKSLWKIRLATLCAAGGMSSLRQQCGTAAGDSEGNVGASVKPAMGEEGQWILA